jgi:indole-3-glycerol phosphate synthase
MGVLSQILSAKQAEIQLLRERAKDALRAPQFKPRAVSLFREAGSPLRLIAELKFRSPSAGPLSHSLDVEGRALAYQTGGASMMSVLCDGPFFDGDYSHLTRARKACDIPLLCKEFVLDEVQLQYAAASGADWVLLIVRCVEPALLRRLIGCASDLGLGALVEVHTAADVEVALQAGATTIGVNARDLDTLQMDPERASQILACVPPHVTSLHLSGIRTPTDVATIAASRVHGALIGEVLMRQDDPVPLLESLVAATRAK